MQNCLAQVGGQPFSKPVGHCNHPDALPYPLPGVGLIPAGPDGRGLAMPADSQANVGDVAPCGEGKRRCYVAPDEEPLG
jgi:hypothetical protein